MTDAQTWNQLADEITALSLENKWLRALQAKPERDLIYIAQPFGGKRENYIKAQKLLLVLQETYPQYDFISPVTAYGYAYDAFSYQRGIEQCLALLSRCDMLWVAYDDGASKGVKIERKFAAEHNIPIRDYSDDTVR